MPTCPRCASENSDTAKFCSECGTPLVVAASREQRKTVTILFCDVTGSTALGERVDPEALRGVMARYFEAARVAIERHGGTVEKFIGDAVMAVFGIPIVHEDDALRAVRAAAELRAAVEIDVRIGVNTGEVVTGGADTLATGDAVNVAARLEQAAGTGEVLLGEQTYALVRDVVEAQLLPPLDVKGKSAPLTAYRLVTATGEARRRDAAPMIGRAPELNLLARAYERAVQENRCHLFTILGTAGIGKSRLVAEFLAGLDETHVLHGRCLSYGEGITYWPVVEIVKQLGATPQDDALAAPLAALLGESDAGTSPPEIAWAVRKALERAALERPLVVVFDDIQWGEPIFLDLIEHISDLSRDAPILLLCMARPELLDARPGWGGGKLNATAVLLEPLRPDDTAELVAALLGASDLELVDRIGAAADGNPLFVEEMVELARVSGGNVAVPPSINALLHARLDSLPREERAVLERGSVEGQIFHRSAVAALAPDEAYVDTRLASLVRKELVRPDRAALADGDAYRFRHLLVRDAAYEALPKTMRIELHERFAEWLDEHGPDLVELDEIVGYHLEQAARYGLELGQPDAGRATRAAVRLAAAALRAEARDDVPATLNLLERAETLFAADDERRLRLLPTLGRVLHEVGRFDDSTRALDEAVERGEPVTSARARAARAYMQTPRDMTTAAGLAEADRAIAELREHDDAAALADAFAARAWLALWDGQLAALREATAEARTYAERAGAAARHAEATALALHLTALEHAMAPLAEIEAFAVELLGRSDVGPRLGSRAAIALGEAAIAGGRFEEGLRLFGEGERGLADLGLATLHAAILDHLAIVEWLRGDWAAMEERARVSWDRLGELGETGFRSTVGGTLALALTGLGRDDEAEEIAEAAVAMGADDDYVTKLLALCARSRVASNRGDHALAIELAQAAGAAAGAEDVLDRLSAEVTLGEVLAAAGRSDEARLVVEDVARRAEERGWVAHARRARAVLEPAPQQ